MTQTILCNYLN
uniref:Uncharacterized protein n=1 Tax=Anguilla anguilla TaxID=7936 RepID=A0A0E9QV68_ANGAN